MRTINKGNGNGYGIANGNKIEEQLSQRFREKYDENSESGHAGRKVGFAIRSKNESALSSESGDEGGEKFFENFAHARVSSPGDVRWLTTGEAAHYLRVSVSSLKTMIYRGQVRAHKLGRRNRFLREELERLITLPVLTK